MNTDNTAQQESKRRKLIAGLVTLSLFPLAKLGFFSKKKDLISCAPESKTIKMLTQEGKLVEIDASIIKGTKEKITNAQLQTWIKKDL